MARSIAEVIRSEGETILQSFVTRVRSDAGVDVPEGARRIELVDALPAFLDSVTKALSAAAGTQGPADPCEGATASIDHGLQRYRLGFDLPSVMREYGVLRECILRVSRGLGAGHDEAEIDVLSRLIEEGCASAAVEFSRQASEALTVAVRAREEAVATVSHDMASPLTSILLATQRLLHGADPPSRTRELLELILDAARTIERMASDLRDLDALDAGRLRVVVASVHVGTLLESIDHAFRDIAAARGVELIVGRAAAGEMGRCDESHARRVLTNLVENALKYTPRGGRVEVTACRARGEVCFRVADSGPGIAKEYLGRIFERGWRAPDATVPGNGIGLHIARSLAEASGGRVGVESQVGEGATFWFSVPAVEGAAVGDSTR